MSGRFIFILVNIFLLNEIRPVPLTKLVLNNIEQTNIRAIVRATDSNIDKAVFSSAVFSTYHSVGNLHLKKISPTYNYNSW